MGLPPLPRGFSLQSGAASPPGPNLLNPLLQAGVQPTNGYRTPGDIERLRSEGYSPAPNSLHLRGDAVDLVPGKSGLSLAALKARADAIAATHPGARALNEGDHVHLQVPGWGMAPGTPGTPNSGLPPLPPGASLVQRGSLQPAPGMFASKPRASLASSTALSPVSLTGQAHDGDTVALSGGRNGRLMGFDAYELAQQGRAPDGSLVPLGSEARAFMLSQIKPGQSAFPVGSQTYGRPVINLTNDPMTDPAHDALRNGLGIAEPQYLQGTPQFVPYMEAERLARLNRLGGFGTNAETPSQFRHKDGPWQGAEPASYGNGEAVFKDEPTPFYGLKPDIAKGYLQLSETAKTPDELVAYANANGFQIDPGEAASFIKKRDKAGGVNPTLHYKFIPAPLTNVGDGRTGAFVRGAADPLNMLDELGGLADTIVPRSTDFDGRRENIWNSNRRFGDILWNNIDQNRAVLGYDELTHPNYRMGGQLASGLIAPGFGIEGLAGRTAEEAIQRGLSETAAQQLGRRAVTKRLAAIGGGEGALAGFGAGEGGPIDRLPNAALGAGVGAAGGALLGTAVNTLSPIVGRAVDRYGMRIGRARINERIAEIADTPQGSGRFFNPTPAEAPFEHGYEAAPIVNDGLQNAGPTPGARSQPQGGVVNLTNQRGYSTSFGPLRRPGFAAMADENAGGNELVGPVVGGAPHNGDVPPLPDGFKLEQPFGGAQAMNERLSPEAMAKLAEGVDPASVLPRPANEIGSAEEAAAIRAGRFVDAPIPNELDTLPVNPVRPANGDLYTRIKMRGPLDITKQLRQWGGVRDDGGDLAHLGIDNAPRRLPFGGNEQFLGKLVNNDKGMSLDEAGQRLWEAGYFKERPTTAEVIDALHDEHLGNSHYLPEDAAAVQEFHRAQSQRYGMEAAAESGSPISEDRGQTINLDDLEANRPPASVYEDAPRLTGSVGNINLGNLENPGQISQLIDQVSKRVGGFSAAARGKVTNAETERLANEMGVKPEQLLRRQRGQALNAEQLYASRALVQRSRESVVRLAKKAVGGSDDDVAAFRSAWLRHVALEEQVSGATAEAGRALQQMKMLAQGRNADGEAVRSYLRGGGGRESIEDAARAIVDLSEDPAKANHFMREAVKPRWRDKFNELYVNSLLSGPRTHVVNFVGNALTTLMSFPELAVTAGIGKVTRSADRAYMGEVGARAAGLADSSMDALRAMKTAFLTGEPLDHSAKVEAFQHEAIGGTLGKVIRTPTRALTAADEFWKSILSHAEIHQLAFRRATNELGKASGPEWKARYAELVRNPTPDMLDMAHRSARYFTFQQPLGPTGRSIQQFSNNSIVGKILLPFVRTPSNIIKFAGERSVFGLAMPEVRTALAAGGRARDEALARIVLGSGLSTAAVVGALHGRLTGSGPSDPAERAALLQSGWQPNSIRVGNQWVSYSRFDPVSTLLGVAADFAEAGKWATKQEGDAVALNLAKSIAKNITSKTWLSGLSDAFNVLSDPDRYGPSYVRKLAASVAVPAIAAQTAQTLDPNLHDARSIMDAIKARIPVVSEGVPVRRDVWGEPVSGGDAIGPNIVSPFYASTISNDPASKEVARLRVPLSLPPRYVTVNGQRVNLDAKQYDEFVQLSGKPAKQYLDQAIRSPEWRAMSDPDRVQAVKDALEDFRSAARDTLAERHPELADSNGPARAPVAPPPNNLPPLPQGFSLANAHH